MSQRTVLILAALTAVLVGYVVVFERNSVTSKELDERRGRVLATFVRDRIDQLEIQRGGESVVLERKPLDDGSFGSWKLEKPEKSPADQDAVDQVLGELEWLSARRTLEHLSAEDAKAFGLSTPRYRIWYRVGGERHVLVVGNADVHGQGVYVRADDPNTAFVVPKTLTEALGHSRGHFRSKEFLGGVVIAWARGLELTRGDEALTLSRDKDQWWYEGSPKTYADRGEVDGVLSALNELRATRYLEDKAAVERAQQQLGKPQLEVRVRVVPEEKREDQSPRLVHLRVAGACPEHPEERLAQAGEQGTPVCVSGDALKPFSEDFDHLREKSLLGGVVPSQIEAFELSSGSTKLAFKRDGEKWIAGGSYASDREAIEQWFQSLSTTEAVGFTAPAPGTPGARLHLALSEGAQRDIVVMGVAPDRSLRVQRGDEPALGLYPAVVADLLEPAAARFSSLSPWAEHKPSEVFAIDAKAEKLARKLVLTQGAWSVETRGSSEQALSAADELRTRELLKSLLVTRALGFVAEQPRPDHGLTPPATLLTLERRAAPDKPAEALRLELGADSARGVFARFGGGPVFEVERQVLEKVRELAGGPRVPAPAAEPALDSEDEEEPGLHHHEH